MVFLNGKDVKREVITTAEKNERSFGSLVSSFEFRKKEKKNWIPASAGMTGKEKREKTEILRSPYAVGFLLR